MKINGRRQIQQGTIERNLFDLTDLGNLVEITNVVDNQNNAGTEITIKTLNNVSYVLVNKTYVDSYVQSSLQGFKIKIGVNGVIDGVNKTFDDISSPSDGIRVLLTKKYTDSSNNIFNAGVYKYSNSKWVYEGELEDGAYWFVKDDESWSIAKSGWGYVCTDPNTPEIELFTGVGQLTASNGIILDPSTNIISAKINIIDGELKLDSDGIGIQKVNSSKVNLDNITTGKFLIKDPNTGKISAVNITASDPIVFANDQISVKDATIYQKGVVTLSDNNLTDGTVITADVLKQKINTLIQTYEVSASQDGSVFLNLSAPMNSVSVYAVYVNGLKLSTNEFNSNINGNQLEISSSEIYANDIVIVDVIQI
jgi:hypothetical protein